MENTLDSPSFADMILADLRRKPDRRLGLWMEDVWMEDECFRFYVKQRRIYCTFTQLMDLWIRALIVSNRQGDFSLAFPIFRGTAGKPTFFSTMVEGY